MFAMRYCNACLRKYAAEMEHVENDQYVVLKVPVEDAWGMIFVAHMAITAGDFRQILNSDAAIVDLAEYAMLLRVEDVRIQHQVMPEAMQHLSISMH